MLVLSRNDLEAILSMADVIGAVERGFLLHSSGRIAAPQRLHLPLNDGNDAMLEMPAFLAPDADRETGALGTKVVTVFPGNRSLGLETVQAVYLLMDPETGAALALMDASFMTAIRTAAASAVATRRLLPNGPCRLGVFGAGTQARFHIRAMIEVAPVERILIGHGDPGVAASFAREMSDDTGVPCEYADADRLAAESNLLCTCTTSPVPLFEGARIKPGVHINAIGAFTPSTRELDSETVLRSRFFIDDWSAAGAEAGELLIPIRDGLINRDFVRGTLSDLVSGRVPGRTSNSEITVYKSCGHALEDLVTARLAYLRANESGAGVRVGLRQ